MRNGQSPGPEALAALHASAFTHSRPWSAAEFAALLDQPAVFATTHAAGFALGRITLDEVELLTIAVGPDERRKGIGGRILDQFLATARARGGRIVFLEVDARNAAALALYHGRGFACVGQRRGYYGAGADRSDALVLQLTL